MVGCSPGKRDRPPPSSTVAAAPHDDGVDVFKEVIEGQLAFGVESGAGYCDDPVEATVVVGNVAVNTHGRANADSAPCAAHAATVVADTVGVGRSSVAQCLTHCHADDGECRDLI
jgi:hypothetical protein